MGSIREGSSAHVFSGVAPAALLASPGADALVGAGALVFPAVFLAIVVLAIANVAGRGPVLRAVGIWAGALAVGTAIPELARGGGSFRDYYVAWIVVGLGCLAVSGWGVHRDRLARAGAEEP